MHRHLAALVTASVLTATLLVGVPTGATAAPATATPTSVEGLLAGVGTLLGGSQGSRAADSSDRRARPNGRVNAPDQTLRRGCHRYRVNYRVRVPSNEWSAEIFVVNPNGRGLHSFALDSNAPDPKVGTRRYELCRRSTVYGVHRLKMKITYCPDVRCREDVVEGFVKPGRFRFKRP